MAGTKTVITGALLVALATGGCGAGGVFDPPLAFEVIQHKSPPRVGAGRYLVGWISVKNADTGEEVQKISVEIDDPEAACLTFGVHREDIDFDGHEDLVVFQHGGAKWGRGHWWIYDPDTNTFMATELSDELREIGFAGHTVDSEKQVIRFKIFEGAVLNEEVYAVEGGRLKLVAKKNVR
jgi:hypothetical protein